MRIVTAMTVVAVVLSGALAPSFARPALACSGRVDVEEGAIRGKVIVLADAVAVGDAINHEPTPGPPSPPRANTSTLVHRDVPFALGGVGATLRIVRAYTIGVDISQPLVVDHRQRTSIEQELRSREAGGGASTSCGLGDFTSRFALGVRYLVFARDDGNGTGLYVISRLPIDGNDVVLDDPLAPFGSSPVANVTATLYHRFFEGIRAEVDDTRGFAKITVDRVPLAAVLRAVAFLRGDPSISPPETGSAGLAAGRW